MIIFCVETYASKSPPIKKKVSTARLPPYVKIANDMSPFFIWFMTLSGLVLIAKAKWRWPNIIQNRERARIPSRHVITFTPRSVLHKCVQWLWYENIRMNNFWFNFEESFEFKYEAIPTIKHHVPQNKEKLRWFLYSGKMRENL